MGGWVNRWLWRQQAPVARGGCRGVWIKQKIDSFFVRVTEPGLVAQIAKHFAQRQTFRPGNRVEPDAIEFAINDFATGAGVNQIGQGIRIGHRQHNPRFTGFTQAFSTCTMLSDVLIVCLCASRS